MFNVFKCLPNGRQQQRSHRPAQVVHPLQSTEKLNVRRTITSLQKELDEEHNIRVAIETRNLDLERRQETNERERVRQILELSTLRNDRRKLKSLIEVRKEENEMLNRKLACVQNEKTMLQSKLHASEYEAASIISKMKTMKREMASAGGMLSTFATTVQQYVMFTFGLIAACSFLAKRSVADNFEGTTNEAGRERTIREELEALRADNERVMADNFQLQKQLSSIHNSQKNSAKEKEEWKRKFLMLRAENERLRGQMNIVKDLINDLVVKDRELSAIIEAHRSDRNYFSDQGVSASNRCGKWARKERRNV